MKNRTSWRVAFVCAVSFLAGMRVQAQSATPEKPPVYTYISEWAVPRAQWADMAKLAEQDKPLMDKLISDGTITGYGAYENLIHQEGDPTHGTWFTATSEGNILKALEAVYKQPGMTTSPVEGASKHWDYLLVSRMYNQHSGKCDDGYLSGDQWYVKPGEMHRYNDLVKSTLVPVFEKMLADGTVTSYSMGAEDFHTQKLGLVTFVFTTADAAAFDKASKAFDEAFDKNPALAGALQSMLEREGHRDFLCRLHYMNNK